MSATLFTLITSALCLSSAPTIQLRLRNNQIQTGGSIGCFGVQAIGGNRIQEVVSFTDGYQVSFYYGYGCQDKDLVVDRNGNPIEQHTAGYVTPQISYSDVLSIRLAPYLPKTGMSMDFASADSGPTDSNPSVQLRLRNNNIQTGGSIGCFGVQAIGGNRIQEILNLTPGYQITFYSGYGCQQNDLVTRDGIAIEQHNTGNVTPQISYTDVYSIRISPFVQSNSGVSTGKSYSTYNSYQDAGPSIQIRLRNTKIQTGGAVGCFGVQAIGGNRMQEILSLTNGYQVTFYYGYGCQQRDQVVDRQGIPLVQNAPGNVTPQLSYSDIYSIRLSPSF
ncbi:hypothetical protein HDV06_002737 [Boothiomyces sp. JEL0866]|nr:hypothetical protein HDV06_002737 [Boothiomyces sp. JEL0866]